MERGGGEEKEEEREEEERREKEEEREERIEERRGELTRQSLGTQTHGENLLDSVHGLH